jgi:hypothetical protein
MTSRHDRTTHVRDPTKDVGVEAHMVLRNVESPLDENVPLQRAAIICRANGTTLRSSPHINETLMRRTFDQVVTLRDVWEQLVEVCIAFAAGYSEAGDGHEVCRNVVHIVEESSSVSPLSE